ncbi:FSH1 domain-containing protein, partial [Cephalotus follicularis]
PRKLRILCLHAFRQNASSFKGRTASLAKKLRRIAEFVFIDAPHIYHSFTNPVSLSQPVILSGFGASLAYLKTVFFQKGPFDGILGFSQGSAMTALVYTQRGRLKGDIDFRFVILCYGFAIQLEELKHGSINYPSLHIFGSETGNDRQIGNQTSRNRRSLLRAQVRNSVVVCCLQVLSPTSPPPCPLLCRLKHSPNAHQVFVELLERAPPRSASSFG